MGVADYGVNGAQDYSYKASDFQSWANFTKLTISSKAPYGCIGDQSYCITIQQNLVDYNVFEGAGKGTSGEYWPQDVPFVAQSGSKYYVNELDNIWNFSSGSAEMGGTIYPNLLGQCSQYGGQPEYYYCVGKTTIKTTLPFEIFMNTTTGVLASGTYAGHSYIEFGIWVYHSGTLVGGGWYDEVAFNAKASSNPYVYVNGAQGNPFGLYNDAETVLCGPGGGSSATISKVAAKITEAYIPLGGSSLTLIPHAWSAGTDTAETVSGVHMTGSSSQIGKAKHGVDNNNQIW